MDRSTVVSSFQFGIFTEVLSTVQSVVDFAISLWVPFNLVFLPKFFQPIGVIILFIVRCEFLSIWYFYRSSFNVNFTAKPLKSVVSSFQFGIFTEVLSTGEDLDTKQAVLWVPFNLVFLPKFFQLLGFKLEQHICCEFLSIWYFYRSSFNATQTENTEQGVVSSFQFGIFTEVLSTTKAYNAPAIMLWVPFNLVFLPKFFQPKKRTCLTKTCCEFLSIWYFYRSSFN